MIITLIIVWFVVKPEHHTDFKDKGKLWKAEKGFQIEKQIPNLWLILIKSLILPIKKIQEISFHKHQELRLVEAYLKTQNNNKNNNPKIP